MLTRQQTAAMRGIAILGIVLHNFTHWLGPMVKENEYTFSLHNVRRFIFELSNPTIDIFAHLLSFFGHYGVPVFLFLSAYGLTMKYEGSSLTLPREGTAKGAGNCSTPPPGEVGWGLFILSHYKKLFMMMIVGYAAFIMVDFMVGKHYNYTFWNVIGGLGMFSNLYAVPDKAIWPGPYWYFGLMVQIYIFYRLVIYRGKGSLSCGLSDRQADILMWSIAGACVVGQLFMDPEGSTINWYRYNFFGGVLPFVAGISYARSKVDNKYPRWAMALFCLLMIALIVGGSFAFVTWALVPLAVCGATVSFVKILPECLLKPMEWVGGISAMMFVTHPIARKVIIPISHGGDIYTGLVLYTVLAIVLAMMFKKLQNK